MSKRMIKTAISALKEFRRGEIKELCIHIETTSGEIMELDIDLDENGDLIKEYNVFDTEEDYEVYLKSEDIPENILYN